MSSVHGFIVKYIFEYIYHFCLGSSEVSGVSFVDYFGSVIVQAGATNLNSNTELKFTKSDRGLSRS